MEHYDQGMVSTSDNVGMPSSVLHTLENGARTVMRENASILQRTPNPESRGHVTWTLPSILKQGPEGLSNISIEELQQCLQPLQAGLEQLDPESLLHLDRVQEGGARLRDGIQVRPLHNLINPQNCDDAVRYIHLSKVPDQYSMGIFVFPPHAKIPLHDHPGMCVMSKVIYGDLHRLCLDLPRKISKAQQKRLGRSWLSWSQPWQVDSATTTPTSQQQRLAFKNHVDHLQAPDCTVLYPYEGNLHEFVAGACGAAVLDVLLPPYDPDDERDCTFYSIRDLSEEEQALFEQEEQQRNQPRHDKKSPCWIVPTGQPEDFHCISGVYGDFGE